MQLHSRLPIFDAINLMSIELNTPLLKMMYYIDLSLVCLYQLKSLAEAIDILRYLHSIWYSVTIFARTPNALRVTRLNALGYQQQRSNGIKLWLVISECGAAGSSKSKGCRRVLNAIQDWQAKNSSHSESHRDLPCMELRFEPFLIYLLYVCTRSCFWIQIVNMFFNQNVLDMKWC